jgi:hypothetical protein
MPIYKRLTTVFVLFSVIFSIQNAVAGDASTSGFSERLSIINQASGFNTNGYFTFRRDLRRCPSPYCSGLFIKAVNRKVTRCADGSWLSECYVANVINSKGIDISHAALLKGAIISNYISGFGAFDLKSAYRSASDKPGQGIFVGLENNGLVCITSPCFSYDQYVLNSNKLRYISGIDLKNSGASAKAIDTATSILANGGVLLAAGINKQVQEFAGLGITFVANQMYFPIAP